MEAYRVHCGSCRFPIPVEIGTDWVVKECPTCRHNLVAMVFPAGAAMDAGPVRAVDAVSDGMAACFFHAERPASVPCGICGRFLCELCDLRIDKRHLCAVCLQSAQEEKAPAGDKAADRVRERTFLPQNMAIIMGVYGPLSIIGLYLMFITAPAAIWLSLRHWNHPGGVQRRGRWRMVVSLLAGLAQLAGMIALIAFVWSALSKAGEN